MTSTEPTGAKLTDLFPTWSRSSVILEPEDPRPGSWAGGPSAITHGGDIWLAYRLRRPVGEGRGYANVVARSSDGVTFEEVARVGRDAFGGDSLERPALLVTPEGRWRLYVSIATPGTKHWRVDLLEADRPEGLPSATPRTVLAGSAGVAVKDPVIVRHDGRWHLWASCHPLDDPDQTDRMTTDYAVSDDGVEWTWQGTVLAGTPGDWDARGVRVAAVSVVGQTVWAAYDGRASAGENWEERTGIAVGTAGSGGLVGALSARPGGPASSPHGSGGLRYVTRVEYRGTTRLYYEATRADGAHDLRTEVVGAAATG